VPDNEDITLEVRRFGFKPQQVTVPRGTADTSITVLLVPIAHTLPEAVVEAERNHNLELRGFYRRLADREKGVNSGQFITQEEIMRRNPARFTLLVEAISGVHVRRFGNCNILVRCWIPQGSGGCFMSIFLDGVRLNRLRFDPKENPWEKTAYPDEMLSPSSIAGIEVYTTAGRVPPEYKALAGCGAILVWTR
jgi:hypothetical protein